jgi:hypothetical protein
VLSPANQVERRRMPGDRFGRIGEESCPTLTVWPSSAPAPGSAEGQHDWPRSMPVCGSASQRTATPTRYSAVGEPKPTSEPAEQSATVPWRRSQPRQPGVAFFPSPCEGRQVEAVGPPSGVQSTHRIPVLSSGPGDKEASALLPVGRAITPAARRFARIQQPHRWPVRAARQDHAVERVLSASAGRARRTAPSCAA